MGKYTIRPCLICEKNHDTEMEHPFELAQRRQNPLDRVVLLLNAARLLEETRTDLQQQTNPCSPDESSRKRPA